MAGGPASAQRVLCPVCHEDKTPQERRLGSRVFAVAPECACDRAARERDRAEQERRDQDEAYRRRLEASGLPRRYQRATFDGFSAAPGTEKALAAAREFAETFAREAEDGLLVRGPTGAGKTHLAAAVAMTLLRRGFSVSFWNVPLLLDALRPGGDKPDAEIMARARRVDLLILDDLGTEKATEWAQERLYVLTEYRYEDARPLIVTTNASLRELQELLSPKTVSRLAEMTRGVTLDAPDYRLRRR